jgi:hypothetical protein
MKRNDNDDQLVLRIPRKLKEQLEQEARASERKLAEMARHILKSWVADRDARAA